MGRVQSNIQRIEEALNGPDGNAPMDLLELRLAIDEVEAKFKEAMDDDFNTPRALAVLFDLAREVRRVLSQAALPTTGAKSMIAESGNLLAQLGSVLGVVSTQKSVVPAEVEELAQTRMILKQEKKYKEADEVRAKVLVLGFTIEDVQGGKYRILPKV